MKSNFLLAAAVYILMVSQAFAQTFEIDPRHSQVTFKVERFGFSNVIGAFSGVTGVISLDQASPENSHVEASIDTTTLYTGNDERNHHVGGKFWLNTAEFSQITFMSSSIKQNEDNRALIQGELSLLGVTKEVTLDMRLNRLGDDPAAKRTAVGFSGDAVLKRSDFGLMTAQKLVGDEVHIHLEVLAHQKED